MGRTLLLLCDETNVDPDSVGVNFFVYGGLIVDTDTAWELHQRVLSSRERHGFEGSDPLKWQTKSRPSQVDRESWNQAKSEVLAAAAELGCALIVVVHHNIASDPEQRHIFQMDALVNRPGFSGDSVH